MLSMQAVRLEKAGILRRDEMNLPEGLSREIGRVQQMKAEAVRMAEAPGVNMGFYITDCEAVIEEGHQAIGSSDISRMVESMRALQTIN